MAMGSTFMDQVYEYATENDLANWGRYQNAVRYEQLASDLGNQYGLWSWYLVGERTSTGEVAWIPRDKDIKDEV
jgi:Tfp pilus assembly protein PilF